MIFFYYFWGLLLQKFPNSTLPWAEYLVYFCLLFQYGTEALELSELPTFGKKPLKEYLNEFRIMCEKGYGPDYFKVLSAKSIEEHWTWPDPVRTKEYLTTIGSGQSKKTTKRRSTQNATLRSASQNIPLVESLKQINWDGGRKLVSCQYWHFGTSELQQSTTIHNTSELEGKSPQRSRIKSREQSPVAGSSIIDLSKSEVTVLSDVPLQDTKEKQGNNSGSGTEDVQITQTLSKSPNLRGLMSRAKPQSTSRSPSQRRVGSEEKLDVSTTISKDKTSHSSDSHTPNTLRNFATEKEDRYVLQKSEY
jgi:hypothetical protein